MEISSSISSLSSTASLSSISLTSLHPIHSRTPHLTYPSSLLTKTPAVEFWYEEDDGGEDPAPAAAERFCGIFLEECRLCKRRLGAGLDAYICAGEEAAFCAEDCREEWMEMTVSISEEKRRRRAAAMMNNVLYSSVTVVEPEMHGAKLFGQILYMFARLIGLFFSCDLLSAIIVQSSFGALSETGEVKLFESVGQIPNGHSQKKERAPIPPRQKGFYILLGSSVLWLG
ncbi:hypothetical protein KSP40_PGU014484 [Platanthera guangdongensis]|uniref:FLZ-type domain-containing protein n=1 Tax=Platanthera guangdongensis TaxID=2320717 RepID=A0ABR2MR92_9ASPA